MKETSMQDRPLEELLAHAIESTQIITQLTDLGGKTTLNLGNVSNYTEIEGTNIILDAPVTASSHISGGLNKFVKAYSLDH